MKRCELFAIDAFVDAANGLLPYCNEDVSDMLAEIIDGIEEYVEGDLTRLKAEREAVQAERRREEHNRLVKARGLRVVKGGMT